MLIVETILKEIKNKGICLIANQDIKKGSITWKYNPIIDIKINKKEIPIEAKDFFNTYACDEGDEFVILSIDNTRFTNHSDNPNTKAVGDNNIALCDIKKGEEITINYNEIDVNGINFNIL